MATQTTTKRIPNLFDRCRDVLTFKGSGDYWKKRYAMGRDSGAGSYGRLARFKAEFVNQFVTEQDVDSVIEFGVGDGHQLSLAKYPQYVGLDVSETAIACCRERFATDTSKTFVCYEPCDFDTNKDAFQADLALSLDVIYHLVEDSVFESYMRQLFTSARRFVVIYSSNRREPTVARHVRHREFTSWIDQHISGWQLKQHVPNKYPYDPRDKENSSFADFFVYERVSSPTESQ